MFEGKWIYIWMLKHLYGGHVPSIISELKRAGIAGVAIKLHNSAYSDSYDTPKMGEFREACRSAGIGFGIWGYVYLSLQPLREAQCALRMIDKYKPDFYLIDAEGHAKNQHAGARIFARELKLWALVPVGLASYRFPRYHRELPWVELRSCCDFDSPQMYYRNSDPVAQLAASKAEFGAMYPILPYLPAGDIYYEHGIRPSPGAVQRYLEAVKRDPDILGTLAWSMDQGLNKTPELWAVYSAFKWGTSPLPPPPPETGVEIVVSDVEGAALQSLLEKYHDNK